MPFKHCSNDDFRGNGLERAFCPDPITPVIFIPSIFIGTNEKSISILIIKKIIVKDLIFVGVIFTDYSTELIMIKDIMMNLIIRGPVIEE
jgi:hypothetical protein